MSQFTHNTVYTAIATVTATATRSLWLEESTDLIMNFFSGRDKRERENIILQGVFDVPVNASWVIL